MVETLACWKAARWVEPSAGQSAEMTVVRKADARADPMA
jgi:hypothetical protein